METTEIMGGSGGMWIFALLILLLIGKGGLFGGDNNAATTADVQRATDFSAIERQMNEGVAATRQAQYDTASTIKDTAYNTLGEIRDIQMAVANGFATSQKCCCDTLRAIDSVNYNGAINTASINSNTTAQTQKILDALSANRMADMQNQINQLQLQSALCGVVRYPVATTYAATNPYSCGCNGTTIA